MAQREAKAPVFNQAWEENTGKELNTSGVYRHEASDTEVLVENDPMFPSAADAYIRMGYVRVGDLPQEYLERTFEAPNYAASKQASAVTEDEFKGIMARLKELEAKESASSKKAEKPEVSQADVKEQSSPAPEEAPSAAITDDADAAMADKALEQSKRNITPPVENMAEEKFGADSKESEDLPAVRKSMSRDALNEIADHEGVEGYDKLETNADVVEAIEKNRNSQKGTE